MNQTILKAVRRLRKVQDAIYNNKIKSNISLTVETHNSNLVGYSYISVNAFYREAPNSECDSFLVYINDTDSPKQVESALVEIADFLRITI